jgi:uncharacterized caspase-like protein
MLLYRLNIHKSTPIIKNNDYSKMPRKVALIIGNDNYSQKPLKQCVADAKNVAEKLKTLDFEVTCKLNLEFSQMRNTIDHFISQIIQPNDYVLFYFSGHGKRWGDQDYLIGCDNNTINSDVLEHDAINVQEKLNEMVKRNPFVTIFLLDCCRDYFTLQEIQGGAPGMNTNVLKQTTKSPQTLIVFACAPGKIVSGNGIFTKHLLERIKESNLDIESFIRQVAKDVAEDPNSEQLLHRDSTLTEDDICIFLKKKEINA